MPLKATTNPRTVKMILGPLKCKMNNKGLLTVNILVCKRRSLETKTIRIMELDLDEEEVIEEDSVD